MMATSSLYIRTFVVLAIAICSTKVGAQSQSQVSAEMNRIADSSQLELKGNSNWKYDLRRDGDRKVVMRVPALSSPSAVRLRGYTDEVVQKVEVNEQGVDGQFEITFILKNSNIDFFDYQTEDPPKLIVDFFPKDDEKPQVAEVKKEEPKVAANQPSKLPAKNSGDKSRKPAATEFMQIPGSDTTVATGPKVDLGGDGIGSEKDFKHGAFDGGDPEFKRFSMADYEISEKAMIASLGNIYLRFPALRLDSPHLATLLKNPPVYEIVKKSTPENEEAQLLLKLFINKRRTVFVKTAKDFLKRWPKTQYEEIIRYMMADTYYELWRTEHNATDFETAMGLYRHLSEKYPDSVLATRTLLLMGYSYLDRGDSFGALKSLQRFLRVRVGTKFTDQVKISIAEAYLNLNRFDDSLAQLKDIETTAKNKKDAVEASFRKGDVSFQQKDFVGAVQAYETAMKKYPEFAGQFPNVWYNTAEAQFWQGAYRKSLDSYREYVHRFPANDHGGYALTRVGELLEIMGAGEKRSGGAFLESQFRYRGTPGANVARIRTLISRFPEMKDKELRAAVNEINDLTAKTDLTGMNEFVALAAADGHWKRGDFKTSTEQLISFYQQNPNAANRGKFQQRVVRNITSAIKDNVEKENFIEALRVNSMYAQNWLKDSNRIDTRYYVGRAFEQAGVYKEAVEIYRDTLNQLYSIRGTKREKERSVFEILPDADSINLRLAKTLVREKNFARAAEHLKALSSPTKLKDKELIERAEVSADVAEARGQLDTAKSFLSELVSTWKGQPVEVSGVYLRLAKLQNQTKNFSDADLALAKIIAMQKDTNLVPEDVYASALELRGDVLLARGDRDESVRTFKELLESYDGKRPLGAIRYKTGKILFDNGDLKGAENIWAELKQDKNDLWHKLAQEQLQGARWKGDYKKYIERIPAMENMKR